MKLRQVKNRDRSTLRRAGPCFQCHEQTPYGDGTGRDLCELHVQFGNPWLDKAFASGFTSPTRTAYNLKRWDADVIDLAAERRANAGPPEEPEPDA